MRILFTSRGSAGHVGPLAPVARAAQRAGHEVLVAVQPRHLPNVERLGLPGAPTADPDEGEWGPLMARLPEAGFDEANALMLGEFFARIDTEAALAPLRELVDRWRPDVMVRESWEYASVLASELDGVPLARVALGLAELEERTIALAAPALDRLRAPLDLAPDPAGDRLRATPYLTVMPAALEDPAGRAQPRTHRFRHDAAPAAPLPDWWSGSDAPLVYVTFGSVTAAEHLPFYPGLYRAAIDALAPLPARVLMTIGEPRDLADLGPLPPNVHAERWVSQESILPHAAAVVGHGGHGTTVGAISHGVPLVVLPLFSTDQWTNAVAIDRAGAGAAIGCRAPERLLQVPGPDELGRVAAAVAAVLRDGRARGVAQRLAADMRALSSVDETVAVLEAMTGAPATA